tara:strand:+ start:567 stop:1397 length:831 start_codon:yes stop_codon:yes gene_type:complete
LSISQKNIFIYLGILSFLFPFLTWFRYVSLDYKDAMEFAEFQSLIGSQIDKGGNWFGGKVVNQSLQILILAGHADSQNFSGAGTSGEFVALNKGKPMDLSMSDELFWNLQLSKYIVQNGKKYGLNIDLYDPLDRDIKDPNNSTSNWSVGAKHSLKGGYALEIHFDSYGEYGIGSGLIPPISNNLNTVDEALASTFGRFPLLFRGGLGAPRRQIRILEIGKLEGYLEQNLRDPATRVKTLNLIANRIVKSIMLGLNQQAGFNPLLDVGDIFLPAIYL